MGKRVSVGLWVYVGLWLGAWVVEGAGVGQGFGYPSSSRPDPMEKDSMDPVIAETSVGIEPQKLSNEKLVRSLSCPSSDGRLPNVVTPYIIWILDNPCISPTCVGSDVESWVESSRISVSRVSVPNSVGKEPESVLPEISREVKSAQAPICVGRVPVRLLDPM